jgi:hypothetical protein
VALGGTVLAPCRAALPPEVLSCRRAPRRMGLNAVGHGSRNLPPRGTVPDVYFPKFLVRPFIFQKSKQKMYKKFFYFFYNFTKVTTSNKILQK